MVLFTSTYNLLSPFEDKHDVFALFTVSLKCAGRKETLLSQPSAASTVQPRHIFRPTENGIQLEVELPAVAEEHVTVETKGRKLFIQGKRFKRANGDTRPGENVDAETQKNEEGDKKDNKPDGQPTPTIVYELRVGLWDQVDVNNIRAESLHDGILMVWLPFKKSETRRIEIA